MGGGGGGDVNAHAPEFMLKLIQNPKSRCQVAYFVTQYQSLLILQIYP